MRPVFAIYRARPHVEYVIIGTKHSGALPKGKHRRAGRPAAPCDNARVCCYSRGMKGIARRNSGSSDARRARTSPRPPYPAQSPDRHRSASLPDAAASPPLAKLARSTRSGDGFLALLEPDARRSLEQRLRSLRVPKGRTVIEHGSATGDVFIVVEGDLRVLLYSPTGREVSVTMIGEGDLFGEFAAIDGNSRAATVVAITAASLRVMSRDDFRACLRQSPAAANWLACQLVKHIRALNNRIFELVSLNASSRLHFELLRLALLSGVKKNRAYVRTVPTHGEIANRIGSNRESVTREMRKLAREGILSQRGRKLEILNIARLSSIVQRLSGQTVDSYMAPHTRADLVSN